MSCVRLKNLILTVPRKERKKESVSLQDLWSTRLGFKSVSSRKIRRQIQKSIRRERTIREEKEKSDKSSGGYIPASAE